MPRHGLKLPFRSNRDDSEAADGPIVKKRATNEAVFPFLSSHFKNLSLRGNTLDAKPTGAPMAKNHTANDITLRNSLRSPLLRLPGELRNKIYEYAIGGHVINIKGPLRKGWPDEPSNIAYSLESARGTERVSQLFALGLVCRQIYTEARLLPYQANLFYFHAPTPVRVFADGLSREQLSCITIIYMEYSWALRVMPLLGKTFDNKTFFLRRPFFPQLPYLKRVVMSTHALVHLQRGAITCRVEVPEPQGLMDHVYKEDNENDLLPVFFADILGARLV